ncbi:MAG: PD-(D/E)XK nuclease family protein [Bowdeniella nasicola]|nr:PD-(D/E)XK nuclease family protein [Bowdeniella nasicola]
MAAPALSPSRAKDFQQCPLLFRYRTVDRLPEPASPAAAKGTLVHAVLERLYDVAPPQRTPAYACGLLPGQWEELQRRDPRVKQLFDTAEELHTWLDEARTLVERYFTIETPANLAPAGRERRVEVRIAHGVLLRGIVDRVDVASDGAMRIVDYKTGKSPRARFVGEALFQMRFYALMIWRLTNQIPARLQLVYIADGQVLTLDPTRAQLEATEAEIQQLWERIEQTAKSGEFPPRKTPLCGWCNFQTFCPIFNGDVLPLPPGGIDRLLRTRQTPDATAS